MHSFTGQCQAAQAALLYLPASELISSLCMALLFLCVWETAALQAPSSCIALISRRYAAGHGEVGRVEIAISR